MNDFMAELDPEDISGLAEELTEAHLQVAFRRALMDLEIPFTLNPDGTTNVEQFVNYEDDPFRHTYEQKLHELAIDVAMKALVKEGLVEQVWLDDQETVGYRLIP